MSSTLTTIGAAGVAIIAVVATQPAGLTLAGGDDGTGATVVVEDAGDQAAAVTLPPVPSVGQEATTTMDMLVSVGISAGDFEMSVPLGMLLEMSGAITDVLPDGGYVVVQSIDHVELTEESEITEIPCLSAGDLALQTTFDGRGQTVAVEPLSEQLTPVDEECASLLAENTSTAEVVFPEEPVGPGARWSATIVVESEGLDVPVTYHYALTEVADDSYTVEVTFDEPIETSFEGSPVTGTISGAGSYTGSTSNPLIISGVIDATVDMAAGAAGEQVDVTVEIAIELNSRSAS